MIFLHFSNAAILLSLQHNMSGPHFSVNTFCLPFCKIANGLSLHTSLWIGPRLFITSWGPGEFNKEESGEGYHRGARQLFVGLLCFCWLLISFFSWCRPFQRIWAGAKRGRVSSFLPPSLFLSHSNLKGPVLKRFNQKTRVSDMWQGHNAWMGQPK